MSWFSNLDDVSLDLLPLDGFEPWVSSDLVQNPTQETVDPRRCCQIAVAAIMGDLNAVYAVEAAHRRQLSATIGDVYIADLVIQAMIHFSRLHLKDDLIPAQRADTLYESLGMVVSAKKCGNMRCGEASWTKSGGKLGFGTGRRVSLMLGTVTGAARGLSGQRLLGLWVYVLSFRREALSVLDVAFVTAACNDLPRSSLGCWPSGPAASSTLRDRRQSFRRRCLFDACVFEALDPSLRFFGWEKLFSEVGLGFELDASTGTSRFASGGGRIGCGLAVG